MIRNAAAAIGLAPILGMLAAGATGPASVLAVAIAIVAALHGYGRLVAATLREHDAPLGLVLAWGLAVYVGIAGVLIAVGVFGSAARIAVIAGGCVVGAAWLSANAARLANTVRAGITARAAVVAVVVAAVAVFVTLAAAGDWREPGIDAETSYGEQLRRLDDTGALDDALGFPRAAGLGGTIAVAALATPLDVRSAHLVDRGVMFVLTLALAVAIVRRRGGSSVAAAAIVPFVLLAVPALPLDMAPIGAIIVTLLAAVVALDRASDRMTTGAAIGVVLVVALAITLRHPASLFGLGILAPLVFAARSWPDQRRWGNAGGAIVCAIVLPYVAAAIRARVGSHVAAELAPQRLSAGIGQLAAWLGIGAVAAIIAGLAVPRGTTRTVALAGCASIAGAGALSPTMTASWQYAFPVALAMLLLIGLETLARPRPLVAGQAGTAAAAVVLIATCALWPFARFAMSPAVVRWSTRAAMMLDDARTLGRLPPASATIAASDHAAAQAIVPAGARLGVWLDRPDLIRHDTHHVVDVRTPVGRACLRALASGCTAPDSIRSCRLLRGGVDALALDYLLVDTAAIPAPVTTTCARPPDPITAVIDEHDHRDLPGGLVLVLLGRSQ